MRLEAAPVRALPGGVCRLDRLLDVGDVGCGELGVDAVVRGVARGVDGAAALAPFAADQDGIHVVAFRMSSRTREGESGPRRTTTPKGRSASSTALAIAAGGAMAPPSPRPFTPSGLRVDRFSI